MKREIKVKFWNGKKMSKPYELLDLLYEGVPEILADANGDLDTNSKKLEKIVTLEFTGLKDKNGKECWEGDRVRFLSGMDSGEHESEVIYKDGAFREGYFNGVLALCPWFEVIGNIYEHPSN